MTDAFAVARLGVGIIGLGGIGVLHARALAEIRDQVDLVAFSGGSPDGGADAGWPEAVQVARDQVTAQPGVDVVAICTPSASHAEIALACLEAGKHIVVEKPLALSVADAERIAALAEDRGLVVSMIAQRRFEAENSYLERLVRSGELGQLRLATTSVHWYRDAAYYASAPWRTSLSAGGGSLMNQGVHNVDLLRWLAGPVESVTAQYATVGHDMEAEDTTVATVRFASGALGAISTSTATPPGTPAEVALHFSRGVVVLGQGEVLRWDVAGVPPPSGSSATIESGATFPAAIGHAGHLAQWRDIVRALRDGTAPAIDAEGAVETVRLLCAIYEAGRRGRLVRPAELC